MKRSFIAALLSAASVFPGFAAARAPQFKAETLPAGEGVRTSLEVAASREGRTAVWGIDITATNDSDAPRTF